MTATPARARHIGVIPARKGSKGVPGKNRYLFPALADFIVKNGFFDRVIVTTDDESLLQMATARGFETRLRPDALAADSVSIKAAFVDVAENCPVDGDEYLWLLFIPLVYRRAEHFRAAKDIVDARLPTSLCSFRSARTHPFACWRIDDKTGAVEHFVENDLFNRQDFPAAWENYNYLSCIRASDLADANANLIRHDTYPFIMDAKMAANMVEIDEPADFQLWRRAHPEDFDAWLRTLPDDCPLLPLKE